MKARLALFVCAIALTACFAHEHASLDGWDEGSSGYEHALAEQKRSGKPVIVYFHTSWCGWCSKLERDVLNSNAFRDRYASLPKVRVDPEESRANAEIASRYGVHGYPTLCVIANGAPKQPIVGYAPPDAYLATLRAAIGD